MNFLDAIRKVYIDIDNGHVDKAVIGCLRISRNMKDYLYTAIFLRELHPNKIEAAQIIYDDAQHLKEEGFKYLLEKSLNYWLETHTLNYYFVTTDDGEKRNILALGVGELDREIEQCEHTIQDMIVPPGMSQYDTAAFTDRFTEEKSQLRLRIKGILAVKDKIKSRCINYVIGIEKQLDAQQKAQSFLEQAQSEVNNYFKAHSEEVYSKLIKASQLVNSKDPEDLSSLSNQVRRAIKASADYFYPSQNQVVVCSDGAKRLLGDDQYLNRLQEFIATHLAKSSSRDLLKAELDHLSVFGRRLNEVASKGVHASVTASEAKQGLLGLYLFLFNVCEHLNDLQN